MAAEPLRGRFEAFASCQPGLEPLLADELSTLGLPGRSLAGGVAFAADLAGVMRACLWLGSASHVLLRIAAFPCRALGELQRKAAAVPWPQWLRRDVPLDVRATARASRVFHTDAIVERTLAAIAATLGGPPPTNAGDDAEVARVHVRFHRDVCTISVDATATPLHRRGYRLAGAKAPLREDLAHALVLASGHRPGERLLDPFCGSGTIAIEAAGRALGLAPGRHRPPALDQLALFEARTWAAVAAAPAPRPATAPAGAAPILASDRDAGAVADARANAERAGVAGAISFANCSFTEALAAAGPGPGVVATNPPFGRRVAGNRDLVPLYQKLGHGIAALGPGWRAAILAHDVRLARRSALPLQAAFTTRHGGLSVTALCGSALVAADSP